MFFSCFYPFGKAGGFQIPRCQGIAVKDYGVTLGALALKPSRFCNVGVASLQPLVSVLQPQVAPNLVRICLPAHAGSESPAGCVSACPVQVRRTSKADLTGACPVKFLSSETKHLLLFHRDTPVRSAANLTGVANQNPSRSLRLERSGR